MDDIRSMFLRQSLWDCQSVFAQSLAHTDAPAWDYLVITAANETQAAAYRAQVNARLSAGQLPRQTRYLVIPDPDGRRVGSGGATLNVMRELDRAEGGTGAFAQKRVLVLHSGGDGQRAPQYSACGKLFSRVPRALPDGRASTLFDEFCISLSGMPNRVGSGMLVLSGDVLLLFNALQIDLENRGAACLSFKAPVETGSHHGVFLPGEGGVVRRFLHKQPVETLRRLGAVNEQGMVDIDTGAVWLDEERVRALNARAETLSREVQVLMGRRQETGARLKLLKEMQRDYEGYQNSVKQVLLQARRTPGSGVHGVVADLIRVPEKLERAMDMALGGALQNVVVDRDEDAKRMIDYLRQNRYGRATFLPISSIRSRTLSSAERRVLSMPGCLGVASELIGYENVYRGVIESLLGRTIVAENLDAGIQIQRASGYACRLVTLDGDVMHSGGSMTGGSVTAKATSLLSRTREVDGLQRALSEITDALAARQEEMARAEAERGEIKRERAELFERLHQQEIAVTRAEAHAAQAQDELDACEQRAGRVRKEREVLAEQLAETERALKDCESLQAEASDSTTVTQAEISQMQRDIFARRNEVTQLHGQVSDARVAHSGAQRDCAATIDERDRLIAQSGNLEKAREDALVALNALTEREAVDAAALEEDIAALDEQKNALNEARARFDASDLDRRGMQERLSALADRTEALRVENDELMGRVHKNEMQLSRAEDELSQLSSRIWEEYELTYALAEEFRTPDFKLGESEKRVAAIRARIKQMGSVNVAAVDEYRQTMERYEQMSAQRDDLVKAQLDLQGIIDELLSKMETQFKTQFEVLNGYFQKTFVALFGGGRAELRLTDPADALNCGIDIVAQPPGKKLQMLSLLSGGERALTAIAILFAMLTLKPTPFCILDEIEAALDDANIDNFAQYLKNYSQKTQFVVVTHRKGTMERCDALYGVAMEEKGVSKMISVQLGEKTA